MPREEEAERLLGAGRPDRSVSPERHQGNAKQNDVQEEQEDERDHYNEVIFG
jgi:hypothetical protein